MAYITGDTHRDFDRVEKFCEENGTTADDVLIILGDAGINYYLDRDDEVLRTAYEEATEQMAGRPDLYGRLSAGNL